MHKTVILERGSKWIFFIVGGVVLLIGFNNMTDQTATPIQLIMGGFMMMLGGFQVFYGMTAFSEESKFAAKLIVTDDAILIKTGYWRKSTVFDWDDIKSIRIEGSQLDFNLKKETKSFRYKPSEEINKSVRDLIRTSGKSHKKKVIID